MTFIKGRLYRVDARNFKLAVYDGDGGFIGVRHKFGGRFLDTERHWDEGPPHGTVRDVQDTGIDYPGLGTSKLLDWLEEQARKIPKECPFCGSCSDPSTGRSIAAGVGELPNFVVVCSAEPPHKGCGARGPTVAVQSDDDLEVARSKAVTFWNRRFL